MPSNKNAIIRYKILDELLSDRSRYFSRYDLLDKVNGKLMDLGLGPVSKRTIELDLNDLELGPFYAEYEEGKIYGKKYIRYQDPTFSIFTKKLTKEEIALLGSVLNTVGQFTGLPNFEWLEALREKLTNDSLGDNDGSYKIIEFSNNPYVKNSNLIAGLFSAISNKQVLELSYRRFQDTEPLRIKVYPYRIKQYNDRWFLICRHPEYKEFSNFPLDRIESFDILYNEEYIPVDSAEIDEFFDDIIGVTNIAENEVQDILFAVDPIRLPYIETKPLHWSQSKPSQEEQEELHDKYKTIPPDWVFVRISCKENKELITTLYAYGADLIILEPADIQEKIVNKTYESIEHYKNINIRK